MKESTLLHPSSVLPPLSSTLHHHHHPRYLRMTNHHPKRKTRTYLPQRGNKLAPLFTILLRMYPPVTQWNPGQKDKKARSESPSRLTSSTMPILSKSWRKYKTRHIKTTGPTSHSLTLDYILYSAFSLVGQHTF